MKDRSSRHTGWAVLAVMVAVLAVAIPVVADDAPVAALFDFPPARVEPVLLEKLGEQLKSAGYSVISIDADLLCDPARLSADQIDLLVLPNAGVLPARAMGPVEKYLKGGGDLIALRTPMWQTALIKVAGQWTTREAYARSTTGQLPEHVLFSFDDPESISGWERSTNHPEVATRYEITADGPAPGRHALHVTIPNLDGWDTIGDHHLDRPFPEGHTLTVFSARGGPRTTRLVVEWVEKDGSRWMAVVPIFETWTRIALPPEAFTYWESVPARAKTRFRPENAAKLTVGLAFTHTGQVGGRHEFWIGPFGTAKPSPEYALLVEDFAPPVLDTLSPGYKLFECTQVARLDGVSSEFAFPRKGLPLPRQIRSPQPRPQGNGFDKRRDWRWIPLLEATSGGVNGWRGTPATMLVHAGGRYKGGIWASFGIGDPEWYLHEEVLTGIGRIARRIRDGLFLIDAGTDRYTYLEGQPVRLGARMVNLGRQTWSDVRLNLILDRIDGSRSLQESTRSVIHEERLTLEPGQKATRVFEESPAGTFADYVLRAVVTLSGAGESLGNDAYVYRPRPQKRFVTVRNGEFFLDGRRWRAHGVNYMPSSGIGAEDYHYFEHWLGAQSYDPAVIERDLQHVRDLGLNAVSIFIDHRIIAESNLLDFLRLAEKHDLKVNLSLRPGTPMDFQWPKIRELIEYHRLAENDTVFAFDLAWEPMWRGHNQRRPYDREWEAWIVERYGSVENAEKDWAFKVPRDADGKVTNPLPHQIDTDGQWRRMVAAYRRFLDTLLYQRYNAARRLVRSIAPHQFVSFRMAEAGNPTFKVDGWIAYDFPYLAGAVDMLAPEAYGRLGDWEKIKPAMFEAEYGRWAAPDKPFIWAEAGMSVWDLSHERSEPEQMENQAEYYRDFYRMLIASGADGVFYWWYPGGFRCHENSDYGIINPDGSDRAVTKVIREHAHKFLEGPSQKPVDYWIEFDRDAHTDGITGVYTTVGKEFWKALEDGRTPGLRTAGTGTDSTNCPPLAVGNTPWNGANPPKYLDGAFDSVQVLTAEGEWVSVEKGGRVHVAADRPVLGRIEVTNLAEARWVAPSAGGSYPPEPRTPNPEPFNGGQDARPPSGSAYLVVKGEHEMRVPLMADAPRFGTAVFERVELSPGGLKASVTVTLTFEAAGRTPFGERFSLTLEPR